MSLKKRKDEGGEKSTTFALFCFVLLCLVLGKVEVTELCLLLMGLVP